MVNRRLAQICGHLRPAVAEATLGSIAEMDARLQKAQQAGLIKLNKLSTWLGVEVQDVDLKNALSTEQIAAVYDALVRHKVLVFHKADLNHAQQVRFTKELSTASPNIGPPTLGHTVFGHVEGYPEVLAIYQGPKTKPRNMERYSKNSEKFPWSGYHCDITACVNPPCIGMLRGDQIPQGIGDTNFGNLASAYETLPEEMKERVLHLRAEHEFKVGAPKANNTSKYRNSIQTRKMVSHHPMVVVHPDSGEKILYNSPGFLTHIVGVSSQESRELLEYLWTHSVEYTIKHTWSKGDLVIWDERSTTHRAPTDVYESGMERMLYRTTLVGKTLQGLDGSVSEILEGMPMLSAVEEIANGMHKDRVLSTKGGNSGAIGS